MSRERKGERGEPTLAGAPEATEPAKRKRRSRTGRVTSARQDRQQAAAGASAEARQVASVILEVLGGALGPTEAAAVLGKTVTQYYKLEARAMQGLLEACEPRPRGRQRNPEKELAEMTASHRKLERECARLQALVRALGKTAGVKRKPGAPAATGSDGKSGTVSRKKGKARGRKPTVRALQLAEQLAENGPSPATEGAAEPASMPGPPPRPGRPRGGRGDAGVSETGRRAAHGATGDGTRPREQAERHRGGQGAAQGDPGDGGR